MYGYHTQQILKRKGIWDQILEMLSQKETFMQLYQTPAGQKLLG